MGIEFVFVNTGHSGGKGYGSWDGSITATGGWNGQKSRAHNIVYTTKIEHYVNRTRAAHAAVKFTEQTLPTPLVV